MKYYIRNNILRQNMKVDTDFSLLHKIMHYKESDPLPPKRVAACTVVDKICSVALKNQAYQQAR